MAQRFVITSGRKSGKCEMLRQLSAEGVVQMANKLVDCPACVGGMYEEDGRMVRCEICNGDGVVTEAERSSYMQDEIDINEARRRYESQFTED